MSEIDAIDRFRELVKNTNKDNPRSEDVQALRNALAEAPFLLEFAGGLARQCQHTLIYNSKMSQATQVIVQAEVDKLFLDLGYGTRSGLEQLLIQQIILCYLRLYLWEYTYHNLAVSGGLNLKQSQEWEKLITGAQKRFLRAIETLSRIRKQNINIQMNIATNDGKQINILE